MPFGDGTGPRGMGSMTGRGAGYCAGFSQPGYTSAIPSRRWPSLSFFWRRIPAYQWPSARGYSNLKLGRSFFNRQRCRYPWNYL